MSKPTTPANATPATPAAATAARPSFFAALGATVAAAPAATFPRVAQPTADTDPATFKATIRAAIAAATAEVSTKRPELEGTGLRDAALSRAAERFNAQGFRPFAPFDTSKRYPASSPHRGQPFWYRESARALLAACEKE